MNCDIPLQLFILTASLSLRLPKRFLDIYGEGGKQPGGWGWPEIRDLMLVDEPEWIEEL